MSTSDKRTRDSQGHGQRSWGLIGLFPAGSGDQGEPNREMAPQSSKGLITTSVLAALLSLSISTAILAINLTSPSLTASGPYSTRQRGIYTSVSTIIATLCTTFITSQIRGLWIARLDERIYKNLTESKPLIGLSATWRSVLSAGSLADTIRNLPILTQFVITGLITTSIVTGFAPSLTFRTTPYTVNVFDGLPFDCAQVGAAVSQDYSWKLPNGSSFIVPAGNCDNIKRGIQLMANINSVDPGLYAYADVGVAVNRSAIGAPATLYSQDGDLGTQFLEAVNQYGTSLVNLSQCVPVMVKNPISCHKGGKVSTLLNSMTATSSDGKCSFTGTFYSSPKTGNTMVKQICAHDDVGQGTIVWAGTYWYAKYLAASIGDAEISSSDPSEGGKWVPGATYVVTCTVDTRSVYEYRNVSLVLQDSDSIRSGFGRSLVGGEPCPIPQGLHIGWPLYATAVAANAQIIWENLGTDGFFESISHVALNRHAPWAFDNSANALEDVLGLTAAQVTARINATTADVDGTATFTSTRAGSGRIFAYIFMIPPLISAVLLFYLLHIFLRQKKSGFSTTKLFSSDYLYYTADDLLLKQIEDSPSVDKINGGWGGGGQGGAERTRGKHEESRF